MNIPKWANWKTTDEDGWVRIWKNKPLFKNGYWVSSKQGDDYARCLMFLGIFPESGFIAENTLVKIQ